jgi:glycosyltransferase involved in cell wall biosynthesis
MKVSMFTSWQVKCGIADYASHLVAALDQLDDTRVEVVPFDRQAHPRADYVRWGQQMNAGDVAHIQHEFSFFGYLLPWRNHFGPFVQQIHKPLVITQHVTFDGPLQVPGQGVKHAAWRAKWWLYNTGLGPYARQLNKDTFDRADQIIVLSARLKEHLLARGIAPGKVHVIPGGVPEVVRAARDEALRASWGWADKTIVCQFGFIAPAKGHLLALEALAQLPQQYVLLIAGGPRLEAQRSYVDGLIEQIAQLGLQQRVKITGYLSAADVPRHIAASDVLIFPNTHADFSYSVMTALAHQAAPVIASDLYSHREIAADGSGLTLFRAGDADDLAEQITRMSIDESARQAAFEKMKRYAVTHSWIEMARRTREVYALAVNGANQIVGGES